MTDQTSSAGLQTHVQFQSVEPGSFVPNRHQYSAPQKTVFYTLQLLSLRVRDYVRAHTYTLR